MSQTASVCVCVFSVVLKFPAWDRMDELEKPSWCPPFSVAELNKANLSEDMVRMTSSLLFLGTPGDHAPLALGRIWHTSPGGFWR